MRLQQSAFEISKSLIPAAIAIRYHVAQHCYLSHMEIKVGQGRAALEDVGNNASDLLIEAGTMGSSPSLPSMASSC